MYTCDVLEITNVLYSVHYNCKTNLKHQLLKWNRLVIKDNNVQFNNATHNLINSFVASYKKKRIVATSHVARFIIFYLEL